MLICLLAPRRHRTCFAPPAHAPPVTTRYHLATIAYFCFSPASVITTCLYSICHHCMLHTGKRTPLRTDYCDTRTPRAHRYCRACATAFRTAYTYIAALPHFTPPLPATACRPATATTVPAYVRWLHHALRTLYGYTLLHLPHMPHHCEDSTHRRCLLPPPHRISRHAHLQCGCTPPTPRVISVFLVTP